MMRSIPFEQIVQTVADLCIQAAYELPADVVAAVQKARQAESNPEARQILAQLLENADIAARQRIPLCQDTGLTVVFIEMGQDVKIESPAGQPPGILTEAIQNGVAKGYEEGAMRKSIVAEPLNRRLNTQTNIPATIHLRLVAGDRLKITVMLKGGGCENKSRFHMFHPTEPPQTVCRWIIDGVKRAGANACPPFVVGVGLGGDFESCCILSKYALLREIGVPHADPYYAKMEADLLRAVNTGGPGPQGLGGDTTALAVHIETAPCHIASLPAAVNIECHSHRHKTARL